MKNAELKYKYDLPETLKADTFLERIFSIGIVFRKHFLVILFVDQFSFFYFLFTFNTMKR